MLASRDPLQTRASLTRDLCRCASTILYVRLWHSRSVVTFVSRRSTYVEIELRYTTVASVL